MQIRRSRLQDRNVVATGFVIGGGASNIVINFGLWSTCFNGKMRISTTFADSVMIGGFNAQLLTQDYK